MLICSKYLNNFVFIYCLKFLYIYPNSRNWYSHVSIPIGFHKDRNGNYFRIENFTTVFLWEFRGNQGNSVWIL